MRNFTLIMLFVVLIFGSHGLFSQDADKVEDKKPEAEPAKTYILTPFFLKDMTWDESIVIKTIERSSYSDRTRTYNLSGKAKISQINNNVPIEFKISDFGGKSIYERKSNETDETSTDEDEIKKQDITFSVDKEYKLTFDVEKFSPSMEFLLYYPAGSLVEFEIPKKKITVGETWKSKNLYPLNFHLLADRMPEMSISVKKSEFKLEKVTVKNNVEIATIKWIGDCSIDEVDGDESITFSWSRTIQFDVTNGRLLSTTGSMNAKNDTEDDAFSMTSTRTLKYEEKATEEEGPKVEPKDDDE